MLQCKIKWKKSILSNLSTLEKGVQVNGDLLSEKGLFPVINGGIEPSGYYDKYNREQNIITISEGGNSCGFVNYMNVPFWSGGHCYTLANVKDIDVKYLYHFLKFQEHNIMKLRLGSGLPNIQRKDIENFKIIFIEEDNDQQKIADILSTCDKVIEKTEETIEKYKQIKAGMMQDLFTRGLDENGKLRPTYAQAPDLYKYSKELDRHIPKEWNIKTFNELIQDNIIDSIQDGNHGEKHPKTSDFVATGVPFIMANNITKDGHVDLKNCNFITYEQYKSLRIGFATENDVLLTHKGTVGLTAIVPSGVKDIMLTPQVTYYRIKDFSKLDNQYLYTYFQSPMLQNILQGLSEQSTRAYIGITKQAELNCVYMDITEQRNIGKVVAKINDKLKYEQDVLLKYKQIKQGLMKLLLTPPADAEIVEE